MVTLFPVPSGHVALKKDSVPSFSTTLYSVQLGHHHFLYSAILSSATSPLVGNASSGKIKIPRLGSMALLNY